MDFVMVMGSRSQVAQVTSDGEPMATRAGCWRERPDGLRLEGTGTGGMGSVVYGFDSDLSYGYPGGTDLRALQ